MCFPSISSRQKEGRREKIKRTSILYSSRIAADGWQLATVTCTRMDTSNGPQRNTSELNQTGRQSCVACRVRLTIRHLGGVWYVCGWFCVRGFLAVDTLRFLFPTNRPWWPKNGQKVDNGGGEREVKLVVLSRKKYDYCAHLNEPSGSLWQLPSVLPTPNWIYMYYSWGALRPLPCSFSLFGLTTVLD